MTLPFTAYYPLISLQCDISTVDTIDSKPILAQLDNPKEDQENLRAKELLLKSFTH